MSNYNPNNPDSQNSQILAFLKRGHSLTPILALKLFDCLRLSGRIWDLRNAGYDIKTRSKVVGDKQKTVAEYYMETEN